MLQPPTTAETLGQEHGSAGGSSVQHDSHSLNRRAVKAWRFVSIKLKGKDIQPGEKIKGDDDWLQGLSFTLKNVSDRPIAFVDVGLRFPQPKGIVVYSLNYGVDLSRGEPRREFSPPAIQPGESLDLVLTKEKYQVFLRILALGGASNSFDTAPYYIERVCFENEPDLIWAGGNLKRRDPNVFSQFNLVERYVLPARQK